MSAGILGSWAFADLEGNTACAYVRVYSVVKSFTAAGFVKLSLERVREPGGVQATREIVAHPGSVVVLPILPDGRVVMVRQYRHAVRQSLWELVAGGIEPGETPREAARRELLEETGYIARRLKPLVDFFPSPGFLTEEMHLIEARGLTMSKARPEADEYIRTGQFTWAEMLRKLRAKSIRDGKTLVGLLWAFSLDRHKTP